MKVDVYNVLERLSVWILDCRCSRLVQVNADGLCKSSTTTSSVGSDLPGAVVPSFGCRHKVAGHPSPGLLPAKPSPQTGFLHNQPVRACDGRHQQPAHGNTHPRQELHKYLGMFWMVLTTAGQRPQSLGPVDCHRLAILSCQDTLSELGRPSHFPAVRLCNEARGGQLGHCPNAIDAAYGPI